MKGLTRRLPKKFILLGLALILAVGTYGFVRESREGDGSSPSADFVTGCLKGCTPKMDDSEAGREYCNCWCNGLARSYSLNELQAISGDAGAWQMKAQVPSKVQDVIDECVAGWKDEHYPSFAQQGWLETCVSSGGGEDYCGCVLAELETRNSFSQYYEMSQNLEQNPPQQIPAEIATAAAACQ